MGVLFIAVVFFVHQAGHRLAARWLGLGVRSGLLECCPPREPERFAAQPLWKRAALVGAGSVSGYLVSVVPLTLTLLAGSNQPVPKVAAVAPGLPAATAGLEVGDTIVAVDGAPTPDWASVKTRVSDAGVSSVHLDILRGSNRLSFDLSPQPDQNGVPRVGIVPQVELVRPSLWGALAEAHGAPLRLLAALVDPPVRTVGGPIAVFDVSANRSVASTVRTWAFAAWLSLAVFGLITTAFFLLPLPGLDGGLLVLAAVEAVTGRKPRYAWHSRARTWILRGLLVVAVLVVLLILKNDVLGILRLGS